MKIFKKNKRYKTHLRKVHQFRKKSINLFIRLKYQYFKKKKTTLLFSCSTSFLISLRSLSLRLYEVVISPFNASPTPLENAERIAPDK